MKKHIYISGALVAAQDLEKSRKVYEFAESVCLKNGFTAYVPHKHTDPELKADADPRDVYEIDTREVLNAQGIIAFVNEPSFGVGLEIMLAVQHNIPVLYLHEENLKISRYLRGFMIKHNYGDAIRYNSKEDMAQKIQTWLQTKLKPGAVLHCQP